MRRAICILLALMMLSLASTAEGAWEAGSASGLGYGKADGLPAGNAPTANASGRNVTVSWTAPGGSAPIGGYVVKRYANGGGQQTIGASCTSTVSGLSCTENNVDPGSWQYTVTPARDNWRGSESPRSSAVTVGSPLLSLNTTTYTALPATSSGQITNFNSGQTVTYRLDNPNSGTVLTGSITPSQVPSNGTASVSVTIPAGTSNGAHTVYAIGNSGDQASAAITVNRPLVTSSVIAKSAGGDAGQIHQGGTYFVYANVSGSGNPPTGLSTLRADVSTVTTGQTSVAMPNGSFTVAGQTYNYRSAQLTANAVLTAGSKSYSLTLTDTAGSTTTTNQTVNVDNTPPTGSTIQTTNVAGGTQGRVELGDTITYTYSEQIDANSILAGWDGASANVVLHLNNSGSTDTVTIFNAANSTQLALGSVNLAGNYTAQNRTFGATGTPSTMVRSGSAITVTLGTASGGVQTAGAPSAMVWTPAAAATDRAGNGCLTTAVPGAVVLNF